MTDYGHDLLFGSFITPANADPSTPVHLAQVCEGAGLDLATFQDHPYQPSFLDTWTLLSYVGARTERIHLAPNVANIAMRPPAVLARAAASLDLLTGGRLELGLGTGAFWDAMVAMGVPRLSPGQAVTALTEAIEIIREVWNADARGGVRVEGEFHSVIGAKRGPAPAHDIGIWLGAYKPRMLALTGAVADGWLPSMGYMKPGDLPAANARIDDSALEAGRTPADIRRLLNVSGQFSNRSTGPLNGPVDQWVEELTDLTLSEGMSAFILGSDDPATLERFGHEVAPAVRAAVAAERAAERATEHATEHAAERAARPAQADDSREAVTVTGSPTSADTSRTTGSNPASHDDGGSVWDEDASSPSQPGAAQVSRQAGVGGTDVGKEPLGEYARLGVTPTPDDGVRLSSVSVLDEDTRPVRAESSPEVSYTAQGKAAGQHLVDIHDHLRSELAQVQDLVGQVAQGAMSPGAARSEINKMTMRQNNWTLGAYCSSYCRIVTQHHSLEDRSVFPHLAAAEPELEPVIDRLAQEHMVIHEVLEGVDKALVALVAAPDDVSALQEAMNLLSDVLLSHLSYEEEQLIEPLARLGYYPNQL